MIKSGNGVAQKQLVLHGALGFSANGSLQALASGLYIAFRFLRLMLYIRATDGQCKYLLGTAVTISRK